MSRESALGRRFRDPSTPISRKKNLQHVKIKTAVTLFQLVKVQLTRTEFSEKENITITE